MKLIGLKKNLNHLTHKQRIEFIEKDSKELTIKRQTELLDISRSGVYYQPIVNLENIRIMEAIDRIYTKHPFKGSRRIRRDLSKYPYFIEIGRQKTRTLMRKMAIEAICPKPNTSKPDKEHLIYPNLIKNLIINRPNQVWATDITYVKLDNDWAYLIAIMDWFSRYVLDWRLSAKLENGFCLAALKNSAKNKNKPKYFHSDQGSQFTSNEFTDKLKEKEIKISMSSKGRCFDNIFVERLWRTVKYEDVYLNHYANLREAEKGLTKYFKFYNFEREHSSLNDKTPSEVYFKNI